MRIDQVIPVLRGRNAVGVHTLKVQEALRSRGIECEIFYEDASEDLRPFGRPLSALFEPAPERTVLFQAAIGSPAFDLVRRIKDPLFVNYHNITNAELIAPWEPEIAAIGLVQGRRQLASLARFCERALTESFFNQRELIDLGFRRTEIAPLLLDMSPSPLVDRDLLATLLMKASTNAPSLLFVGQISPHKAQHDLVSILAALRALYFPNATLTLIGEPLGKIYPQALRDFIESVGLTDAVNIVGGVDDGALEAYWQAADVFVSTSEHEGFGVPLIEAMGHELPVIAFASSAVPETIGNAGLVLTNKDPLCFAAAIHRVMTDAVLRRELVARGSARAASFDLSLSITRFIDALLSP